MSKIETEAKFLEIDRKDVIRRLKKLDGKTKFNGRIEAIYLEDPEKRDNITNRVRRLIEKNSPHILEWTIKEELNRDGARTCKETNVHMVDGDLDSLLTMLKINGIHEEIQRIRKKRLSTVFRLDGEKVTVDIDDMKQPIDIPTYLEIEADTVEEIHETADLLDLNWDKRKLWSTKRLLEYYGYKPKKK